MKIENIKTTIVIGSIVIFVGMIVGVIAFVPPVHDVFITWKDMQSTVFITDKMVQDELNEIKARGEISSIEELRGPKVPDSENAAIIYEKIFKQMQAMNIKTDADSIKSVYKTDWDKLDSAQKSKIRAIAKKYEPIMPQLDAALSKPQCKFDIQWEKGSDCEFPQFSKLRNIAILLQARCMVCAIDKDSAGGRREIHRMIGLGRSMDDIYTLIARLAEFADLNIMTNSVRQYQKCAGFSMQDAQALDKELAAINISDKLKKTYEGERLFVYIFIDNLQTGKTQMDSAEGKPLQEKQIEPLFRANKYYLLKESKKTVANANKPYREIAGKVMIDENSLPKSAFLAIPFIPLAEEFPAARDKCIANIDMARISLKLDIFKKQRGSYPVSMSELGKGIPKDPFSAKAFKYKRNADGYVLYSIGRNLKDDAGKPQTFKYNPDKCESVYSGDYVWVN